MYRFEDDRYYRTSDPELLVIATPGTMAKWRCRGIGPPYIRFGGRILYIGRDLNEWLEKHRVNTQVDIWPGRAPEPAVGSRHSGEATSKYPTKGSRRSTDRAAVNQS